MDDVAPDLRAGEGDLLTDPFFGCCATCLNAMREPGRICDAPDHEYSGTGFETCGAGPFCSGCYGEHLEFEYGWRPEPSVVDDDEEEEQDVNF